MSRLTIAVIGQLSGVIVVALGVSLAYPPAGVVVLGAGLIWWWRYVFDVGGAE